MWRFAGHGVAIERRLVMAYGHNTTVDALSPRSRAARSGSSCGPALQFRGHDEPVSTTVPEAYPLHALGARIELAAPAPLPSLRFHLVGARSRRS